MCPANAGRATLNMEGHSELYCMAGVSGWLEEKKDCAQTPIMRILIAAEPRKLEIRADRRFGIIVDGKKMSQTIKVSSQNLLIEFCVTLVSQSVTQTK